MSEQFEYCDENSLKPAEIRAAFESENETDWTAWRVDGNGVQWFKRPLESASEQLAEIHGIPPEAVTAASSSVEIVADDEDENEFID